MFVRSTLFIPFILFILFILLIIPIVVKFIQYLYNELYPKLRGFERKTKDKINLIESFVLLVLFNIFLSIIKTVTIKLRRRR